MEDNPDDDAVAQDSSPLFLALYIILLTFFIALVAVSSPNEERRQLVVDSVLGIFSTSSRADFLRESELSQSGRVIAVARQIFADVGTLFQSEIPAARIRERTPGRVLEVSFPALELFSRDEARVRQSRVKLIDGVIAALAFGSQEGVERRMSVVISTGEGPEAQFPGADSLEHRRAAALGELVYSRGAEPGTIDIGLSPGPFGQVTFTFRVHGPSRALENLR